MSLPTFLLIPFHKIGVANQLVRNRGNDWSWGLLGRVTVPSKAGL